MISSSLFFGAGPAARLRLVILFALLAACFAASSASASMFDLAYTGPTNVVNAILVATLQSNGSYLATSATGTWNGKALTLAAVNAYGGNDNLIFPSSPTQFLQYNGITFSNGTNFINLYSVASGTTVTYNSYTNSVAAPSDTASAGHPTSLMPASAPGPVPGAGLLSFVSLLIAGLARWWRVVEIARWAGLEMWRRGSAQSGVLWGCR